MVEKFKVWLNTPFGSFLKISLGVLLASLLDYTSTEGDFGLVEPWNKVLGLLIVAGVPILINSLNSADTRYGIGSGGSGGES